MTATHSLIPTHNTLPYLTDEDRTYDGYGATASRPAPKYVRSLKAWERASQKIVKQTGLTYDQWSGKQFGAATKIYKATIDKYGLDQPGPDPE
jgi:hypothetical protein